LPILVVGTNGGSFRGDDYDEERIIEAINKETKSWTSTQKKTKK